MDIDGVACCDFVLLFYELKTETGKVVLSLSLDFLQSRNSVDSEFVPRPIKNLEVNKLLLN